MALTDINSAITTSMNTATTTYPEGNAPWDKNVDGYNIENRGTDTAAYQVNWWKWHGMYRVIPEMRTTIDAWCRWIVSKKISMDEKTKKITNRINGNGKDTFKRILLNIKRVSKICGDGYAEIIRDRAGRLMNIKPIDPGTIKVVYNNKLIIKEYEQVGIKDNQEVVMAKWNPKEMFHAVNDRIADEIHGIPEPEKLINIVKWRHQSMSDMSVVFHRYVKPLLQINADTDDESELSALKTKYDNAVKNMENLIIPKGSVDSTERISIPQYSTLDPLPWIILLRDYFVLSSGVPDIVLGHSRETSLAAGKLNYLAYKEKIEQEQADYEEDIEKQLGIKVKFERPIDIDIEQDNKAGTNTTQPDKKTQTQTTT